MLTPSFANNSRGMPCAIASEDASEDTSLDCWNYILLNCSIPTRTSFAASQMWVGIEKSCTYTEMCQHSLMASNGELSLEKDWFCMQKQRRSVMHFCQSASEVRMKSSFDRIEPIKVDHWKGLQNN